MKKLAIMMVAALALMSCGNKAKSVKLESQADSMNYCMGFATGLQIKGQLFATDSSDEAINEFIDAIEYGYKHSDEEKPMTEEVGEQIGMMVKEFEEQGLGGNAQWVYNGELFLQGIINSYEGDSTIMPDSVIMPFLMMANQQPVPEGIEYKMVTAKCPSEVKKVEIKNYMDSINYAFGAFMGKQLKSQLVNDTVTEDIKGTLVKTINESMNHSYVNPEAYKAGLQIGKSIKMQEDEGLAGLEGLETNFDLIKQGMINGLYNYEDMITLEEAQEYLETTFNALSEKKLREENAEWIKEQEKFLADNKKAEGVQTTASGLQYKVIKEGNGVHPTAEDTVEVVYVGKLINDTIFDDSHNHGGTVKFALNQVIKGWTEGIQLMSEGAHYQFVIPENLAYGAQAPSPQIKAFSTLVFDVELKHIIKAQAAAPAEMPAISMEEVAE